MTKGRKTRSNFKQPKLDKARRRMIARIRAGIDDAAEKHIRLLLNPCSGPLTVPAYPVPGGGTLVRYRSVVDIGTGTGETGFLVHVVPGANQIYANGAATGGTLFTPNATVMFNALASAPSTAAPINYRCVAFCLKFVPYSSEMNRSGVIYAGHTDARFLRTRGTNNMSIDTAKGSLPFMSRSPDKSFELLWVPNEIDGNFVFIDSNLGGDTSGGGISHAAITLAATGLKAAEGGLIELTGVYEVDGGPNTGFVTTKTPPPSSTPFVEVLRKVYDVTGGFPALLDGVRATMGGFNSLRNAYTAMTGSTASAANSIAYGVGQLALTL